MALKIRQQGLSPKTSFHIQADQWAMRLSVDELPVSENLLFSESAVLGIFRHFAKHNTVLIKKILNETTNNFVIVIKSRIILSKKIRKSFAKEWQRITYYK